MRNTGHMRKMSIIGPMRKMRRSRAFEKDEKNFVYKNETKISTRKMTQRIHEKDVGNPSRVQKSKPVKQQKRKAVKQQNNKRVMQQQKPTKNNKVGITVEQVELVMSQPWPIGRAGSCELMIACRARATGETRSKT